MSWKLRGRSPLLPLTLFLLLAVPTGPSQAQRICPSDCDRNVSVSVSELIRAVNILLGASPGLCSAADVNGDGSVTVAELIQAVNASLYGCFVTPPTRTPTPRATNTPTFTRTPTRTPTIVVSAPQLSGLTLSESNDREELDVCETDHNSSNAIHYEFDYVGDLRGATLRLRLTESPSGIVSEFEFDNLTLAPGTEQQGRLSHWICYLPNLELDETRFEVSVISRNGLKSNTLRGTAPAAEPLRPRLTNPRAFYATRDQADVCFDFGNAGGFLVTLDYNGRWDGIGAQLVLTLSARGETEVSTVILDEGGFSREAGLIAVIQCLTIPRFDFDVRVDAELRFRDGDRSNTVSTTLRR